MKPEILVSSSIYEQVVEHCTSDMTQEVGGFLLGDGEGRTTHVRRTVPARHTEAGQAHLTFTHDSWTEALDELPHMPEGSKIVGWYHSHPGHGVFLSEYDLFIQRNFFGSDDQVALVMDPHTGEARWFINEGENVSPFGESLFFGSKAPGRTPGAESSARPLSRSNLVLPALALVAVGALAGFIGSSATSDDTTVVPRATLPTAGEQGDNEALQLRVEGLQERIRTLRATNRPTEASDTVTVDYRVRSGDTLWGIAESMYGDGGQWVRLKSANKGIDAGTLQAGQLLSVPEVSTNDS